MSSGKVASTFHWKGEEAQGRPGPHAPDIDDGVKVNIRPFQEAGLLAATVIKKW